MKKYLALFYSFICFVPFAGFSQLRVQRALFSQYHFNGLAVNPAFSALEPQGRITALTRNQWVGFEGAPQTQTLSAHATLPNDQTSIGAMFVHDRVGVESEQAFFASVAHRVQLTENSHLAAGFTSGIGYYLGNYGSLSNQDPVFVNQSSWRANVGLGLLYFTDRWELGFSVPYLAKFTVGQNNSTTSLSALRSDFYLTANYRFKANDFIKLKPSLMVKYTAGVPLQYDINMNAYFEEKGLSLGLGYRSQAAVTAMFQVKLNQRMQLGYAYDFMTDIRLKHQMGTHEVMLNYRFKGSKKTYNADDYRF
ncbi:MAG: hypothetical protein RI924_1106 [Bacteroidota bacterium]